MKARTKCKQCDRETMSKLVKLLTSTGAVNVFWQCEECGQNARGGGNWISHKKLFEHKIKIDEIPLVADLRSEYCAVCGALGAELHHWAPRAIFGEQAESYPTAYLCHKHHLDWHERVTPGLVCKK